ncbi:hypothetical protein PsorP6_014312 [Peronosclerospora sorghi]|uniref:Uncharacterized protein n=1 Tax=Peronosclerospora sorghi TaxID=230839 RepID=A0ACC0VFP1_9STRA|nr:hypothetical protein PsorP6_014312 [Peronosclerospora sorghi]
MAKNMDASTLFGDDCNKLIYVAWTGNSMRPRSNTRSARNTFYGLFNVGGARQIDTDDESIEAEVTMAEATGSFNAEYFDTDDDWLDDDDSQMEDGRGSYHAVTREGHLTEQHGAEEGNGQGKTRQRGSELPVAKTHE